MTTKTHPVLEAFQTLIKKGKIQHVGSVETGDLFDIQMYGHTYRFIRGHQSLSPVGRFPTSCPYRRCKRKGEYCRVYRNGRLVGHIPSLERQWAKTWFPWLVAHARR